MSTFVQWKGTDLCMDFQCPECSAQAHFDGLFAYAIQCPGCGAYFEMPTNLPLTRVSARPAVFLGAEDDVAAEILPPNTIENP